MKKHPTDEDMMDWLDDHIDEISVIRDRRGGTTFHLTWCHSLTSCPTEISAGTLRIAVLKAMKIEKI